MHIWSIIACEQYVKQSIHKPTIDGEPQANGGTIETEGNASCNGGGKFRVQNVALCLKNNVRIGNTSANHLYIL